MITPYLQQLLAAPDYFQDAIKQLLDQYHVVPVGNGYIDLIVPITAAVPLIAQLALLPVAVEYVAWWCHCTPQSIARLGCPHGMGGPSDPRGPGWFSECVGYPGVEVADYGVMLEYDSAAPAEVARACHDVITDYLIHRFPVEPFYSPCLTPGLWLYVPENWQRLG